MSTISNKTITQTVTLGTVDSYPTYASPLTIAASGAVEVPPYGNGIYGGSSGGPWSVVNYGTISASLDGVKFAGSGFVDNEGGLIQGKDGIVILGTTATVVNSATIVGTRYSGIGLQFGGTVNNIAGLIAGQRDGINSQGSATITNSSTIRSTGTFQLDAGIYLGAGGAVTNETTGLIAGPVGIFSFLHGGTVSNAGTILGGVEFYGAESSASVGNSGVIDGAFGVDIAGNGTVGNTGTITGTARYGVLINFQGSVGNTGTAALITGYSVGVSIHGAASTVVNNGTIVGGSFSIISRGIELRGGGTVINTGIVTATGSGGQGVLFYAGTVGSAITNSGTITAPSEGIDLNGGGTVSNTGGGLIQGRYGIFVGLGIGTIINTGSIVGTAVGVDLISGGTVINAGAISGAGGTSIAFGGSFTNRLVVEPGAVFSGAVAGGSGDDTLELDGTAGNPLTVNYNSLGLSNFEDVAFGSGGNATLAATNVSGTLPLTVSNFTLTSDVIDLTAIGTDGMISNSDTINHRVTVTGSLGAVTLQLDASDSANLTTASDGVSGTDLGVAADPCFCRGTLILTDRDEVPVEELAVGDLVRTSSGGCKPITWIGYGRRLITSHNAGARPMIVRRDALADGVPCRDLRLTRAHSLYLGGILVPVEYLLNGSSVLWDENAREVEFYHIELRDHDVLIADGAPAESYRDDGNRALFDNIDPPCFTTAKSPWFAPVRTGGPEVEALWCRILDRCAISPPPMVDDPDLHLMVDERRFDPIGLKDGPHPFQGVYHFRIERPPNTSLRIASRQVIPAMVGLNRDPRQLGVAVRSVILRDAQGPIAEIWYDSHLLADGFNNPEPAEGHRWTTGSGALPRDCLALYDGPFELAVEIVSTAKYPVSEAVPRKSAMWSAMAIAAA